MSTMTLVTTDGIQQAPPGRFQPGNKAARGNPNTKKMSDFRRTLLDAVDPEELRKAFQKLQENAVGGCLQSMQLYLAYAVGRPTQAIEISGHEGESLGGDLRELVMAALSSFPEARIAVAAELRAIRDTPRSGDDE